MYFTLSEPGMSVKKQNNHTSWFEAGRTWEGVECFGGLGAGYVLMALIVTPSAPAQIAFRKFKPFVKK